MPGPPPPPKLQISYADPPPGTGRLILTNTAGVKNIIALEPVPLGAILDSDGQSIVANYAFGQSELHTQAFPLQGSTGASVGVSFDATGLTYDFPAEAQLFARDPEELGQ